MRTAAFLVTAALFTAGPAIAMSGNWYVAQARNEVRDCNRAADEANWKINAQETVVSSCFAGGFITQVDFYKEYDCKPNRPCPRVAAFLVSSVQFGCDDDIIAAECFVDGFCEYDGSVYEAGESFPDADGCNTCFCGDDGLVGCTKMACL